MSLAEGSPAGQSLCLKRAPRELSACVVSRGTLFGDLGPAEGLLESSLTVEGLAELCGLRRQARLLAPGFQPVATGAE